MNQLNRRVEKLEAQDAGAPRVACFLVKAGLEGDELALHQRQVAEAEARGEKVLVIELVAARGRDGCD